MAQILVVDDEVGIRELLSDILADEGKECAAARKRWREAPRLGRFSMATLPWC